MMRCVCCLMWFVFDVLLVLFGLVWVWLGGFCCCEYVL